MHCKHFCIFLISSASLSAVMNTCFIIFSFVTNVTSRMSITTRLNSFRLNTSKARDLVKLFRSILSLLQYRLLVLSNCQQVSKIYFEFNHVLVMALWSINRYIELKFFYYIINIFIVFNSYFSDYEYFMINLLNSYSCSDKWKICIRLSKFIYIYSYFGY